MIFMLSNQLKDFAIYIFCGAEFWIMDINVPNVDFRLALSFLNLNIWGLWQPLLLFYFLQPVNNIIIFFQPYKVF